MNKKANKEFDNFKHFDSSNFAEYRYEEEVKVADSKDYLRFLARRVI